MKPGEYTGKDGITYRWEKTSEGYTVVDCCSACWSIAPADWPAAKAALDGLVEEEWVEIRQNDTEYTGLCCRPDGTRPQWFKDFDQAWHDDEEDADWIVAYRKGLEIGEAKGRAALAQVKELVGAVLSMPDTRFKTYGCSWEVSSQEFTPLEEWLKRIHVLAEEAQL